MTADTPTRKFPHDLAQSRLEIDPGKHCSTVSRNGNAEQRSCYPEGTKGNDKVWVRVKTTTLSNAEIDALLAADGAHPSPNYRSYESIVALCSGVAMPLISTSSAAQRERGPFTADGRFVGVIATDETAGNPVLEGDDYYRGAPSWNLDTRTLYNGTKALCVYGTEGDATYTEIQFSRYGDQDSIFLESDLVLLDMESGLPKAGQNGFLTGFMARTDLDVYPFVEEGYKGFCNKEGNNAAVITFLSTHGDVPALIPDFSGLVDEQTGVTLQGEVQIAVDGAALPRTSYWNDTLKSVTGTREYIECSGRGLCDHSTGSCMCNSGYAQSDGNGQRGEVGDCGYVIEFVGVDSAEE